MFWVSEYSSRTLSIPVWLILFWKRVTSPLITDLSWLFCAALPGLLLIVNLSRFRFFKKQKWIINLIIHFCPNRAFYGNGHTLPSVLHIDNISERRREVKLWFLLPNKKSVNVKNESPEKISCSSNPTYVLDRDTGASLGITIPYLWPVRVHLR